MNAPCQGEWPPRHRLTWASISWARVLSGVAWRLTRPVLLIAGAHDRQTIPVARRSPAQTGADLGVLAPAGHRSFLEPAAAWAEAVDASAARVLGVASPRRRAEAVEPATHQRSGNDAPGRRSCPHWTSGP